jgi:transcriptional regulator with XRE-family HTH domain
MSRPQAAAVHLPVRQVVGQQVKHFRKKRGWSQQRLADEVTALGLSIDATTITRTENARRALTVEEFLALALVLNVQPAALITQDGTILEVTPEHQTWTASETVWEWFGGRQPIGNDQRAYFDSVSDDEAESIRLLPGLHDVYVEVCHLKMAARFFARSRSTEDRDGYLQIVRARLENLQQEVQAEIDSVDRTMATVGLTELPVRSAAGTKRPQPKPKPKPTRTNARPKRR